MEHCTVFMSSERKVRDETYLVLYPNKWIENSISLPSQKKKKNRRFTMFHTSYTSKTRIKI